MGAVIPQSRSLWPLLILCLAIAGCGDKAANEEEVVDTTLNDATGSEATSKTPPAHARAEAPAQTEDQRRAARERPSIALTTMDDDSGDMSGETSTRAIAAEPRGSLQGLFSADDYPPSALDNNEQGDVSVTLAIGPSGRVTQCFPNGSASTTLKNATCRLIVARARFDPARDASGNPTTGTFSGAVVWRISE